MTEIFIQITLSEGRKGEIPLSPFLFTYYIV